MHTVQKKRLSLAILISLVFFCLPPVAQARSNMLQGTGSATAYAITVEGEYIYIVGEAVNFQGELKETDLDLSGGLNDILLAKLRMDGTPVFTALIGGSDNDAAYDIAVREGVVYILGETWSIDFPGAPGNAGENDALLLALAADGSEILWARRFGGSDQDSGRALTIYNGYLYLTGITWSDDLVSESSLGDADGFLASVGLDGQLEWLKIFGGGALDAPYDLMVSGNDLWVAGQSFSRNFGGSHQGEGDAFAARFNLDGDEEFGRLYGGSETDIAFSISSGGNGAVILVGGTRSGSLPAAVSEHSENYDGFLMTISPDGAVQRSIYIGGTGVDYIYDIGHSPGGELIVVGETNSPSFPLGYDHAQDVIGEGDAFIVQINSDGELIHSLLKGSPGPDYARDSVLTSSGLWLAGKFGIGDISYGLLVPLSELGSITFPTDEPPVPTATLAYTATPQPTETPRPTHTPTPLPTNPQTTTLNAIITTTAMIEKSAEPDVIVITATSTNAADQTSEVDQFTSSLGSTQESQGDGAVDPGSKEEEKTQGGITGWVIGGATLLVVGIGGFYYWYQHKKTE